MTIQTFPFLQPLKKCLILFVRIMCSFSAIQAGASEPAYLFKLREDSQPELCTHMEAVFNDNFKHMWAIPIPTDAQLSIYSSESQYAFLLLPDTMHNNAMTNVMMYSKVPTSPEFSAVHWLEGHASARLGRLTSFPFLIAYFDIDNDGVDDTVVKTQFTKGYNAIIAAGESGDVGEKISVYHDKRVTPTTSITVTELAVGSESLGKPAWIIGNLVRPFIYAGKSYVATYDAGFFDEPTKRSRLNIKTGLPPAERMVISSYTLATVNNAVTADVAAVRSALRGTTLCAYDMIQAEGIKSP